MIILDYKNSESQIFWSWEDEFACIVYKDGLPKNPETINNPENYHPWSYDYTTVHRRNKIYKGEQITHNGCILFPVKKKKHKWVVQYEMRISSRTELSPSVKMTRQTMLVITGANLPYLCFLVFMALSRVFHRKFRTADNGDEGKTCILK